MATAERIAWIDFAKGVAIILMVLGHVIYAGMDLFKFIFVFHMPFFFVVAGYLLNLNKWGGAENFKPFVAKLFSRLLVPYFIAEFLWYPIWFVVFRDAGHLKYLWGWNEINPLKALTAIFIGNGNGSGLILEPLWFLPALLCAEIIFVKLFNRLNKFGAEVFSAAVAMCSLLGLCVGKVIALPFGMDIALAAQIFLLAGVLIRKYNLVERIDLKICVALTLILSTAFSLNAHVNMDFRRYGEPFLFYAGGLAGTLLLMKLSALTTGGKIFSLISDCGRQTMMILVLHPIVINVLYEILVGTLHFSAEEIYTDSAVIFCATATGVLISLFIAKKFGKLPVLKYFCA